MFLDAHAPDLNSLIGVAGNQTIIQSGGGIVEYGGLNITSPDAATAYQADLLVWLQEFSVAMKTAGKFLLINLAGWSLYPSAKAQIVACNGAGLEGLLSPGCVGVAGAGDGVSRPH
jgi:hypothetical protein